MFHSCFPPAKSSRRCPVRMVFLTAVLFSGCADPHPPTPEYPSVDLPADAAAGPRDAAEAPEAQTAAPPDAATPAPPADAGASER